MQVTATVTHSVMWKGQTFERSVAVERLERFEPLSSLLPLEFAGMGHEHQKRRYSPPAEHFVQVINNLSQAVPCERNGEKLACLL